MPEFTKKKLIYILPWAGIIIYAIFLAPRGEYDLMVLFDALISGNMTGIDGILLSLFNFMGIWPLLYFAAFHVDGKKAIIILFLSFFTGGFIIAPYMALRKEKTDVPLDVRKSKIVKLAENRIIAILVLISAIFTLWPALVFGDLNAFINAFLNTTFVHVMTLDFILLWGLSPFLVFEDMKRRGWGKKQQVLLLTLLPVFGVIIYGILRPKLSQDSNDSLNPDKEQN